MITMSPKFFRLEFATLASVGLLYGQFRMLYASWSKLRVFIHFTFILIFALIGVGGLRAIIELIFGSSHFLATFRAPNILQLPPSLMCVLAGAYGVVGTVFFISVMYVGKRSAKARRVFLSLVGPATIFYPAMMASFTQASETILRQSIWLSVIIFATFAALAVASFRLFRSDEYLPHEFTKSA